MSSEIGQDKTATNEPTIECPEITRPSEKSKLLRQIENVCPNKKKFALCHLFFKINQQLELTGEFECDEVRQEDEIHSSTPSQFLTLTPLPGVLQVGIRLRTM